MKLFYDMMVPFMPTSIVENEKATPNEKLGAARQAMIRLAAFQNDHMINSLYDAIYYISIYGEISIVDLLYSLGSVEVATGNVDELIDIEAKNLFKTVLSDDPFSFDYRHFAATLLMVAHTILTYKEPESASAEIPNKEDAMLKSPVEELSKQS